MEHSLNLSTLNFGEDLTEQELLATNGGWSFITVMEAVVAVTEYVKLCFGVGEVIGEYIYEYANN